ncbi:MAG: TetR/AcrR family transcriptional regulator [Bacteroidota bacterium]
MADIVKSRKYAALIATGRELFWRHGFRRVTVEEICKKAGVSKMTYYKFFSNKTELAKTVFQSVVDEGVQQFKELMLSDVSPSEKIRGMIMLKMESTNQISREFLEDFYTGSDPELQKFVSEVTLGTWNSMLSDFQLAQSKGIFRPDFKPEFLIQVSFKMVDFLKDEKLLALYDNPQDLIVEFSKFIAWGISPHD